MPGAVRTVYVVVFALVGRARLRRREPDPAGVRRPRSCRRACLRPAVALAAAVFQTTRLVGPAVAASLIGTAGIGWAFAANAPVLLGPMLGAPGAAAVTPARAWSRPRPAVARRLAATSRQRPQVAATIVLVGLLGTFGLNFPSC